jgi:hypothetical protein
MIKRLTTAAATLILLSACAGGPPPEPPAPPPLDPTGTYDITVDAEGMTISGVMVIRGSAEEGYTGSMDTDMGGAGVSDIVVEGQTVTFYIPEAEADVQVIFEGDGFTGGMSGMMGDAGIVGKRRQEG